MGVVVSVLFTCDARDLATAFDRVRPFVDDEGPLAFALVRVERGVLTMVATDRHTMGAASFKATARRKWTGWLKVPRRRLTRNLASHFNATAEVVDVDGDGVELRVSGERFAVLGRTSVTRDQRDLITVITTHADQFLSRKGEPDALLNMRLLQRVTEAGFPIAVLETHGDRQPVVWREPSEHRGHQVVKGNLRALPWGGEAVAVVMPIAVTEDAIEGTEP